MTQTQVVLIVPFVVFAWGMAWISFKGKTGQR